MSQFSNRQIDCATTPPSAPLLNKEGTQTGFRIPLLNKEGTQGWLSPLCRGLQKLAPALFARLLVPAAGPPEPEVRRRARRSGAPATFCLLLSAFCFLPSAFCQFTLVTGTVTDPNGIPYTGGTITADFVTPGGASATLQGLSCCSSTGPVQLDSTGGFTMRLADNSVVLPGGTQWRFTVNHTGEPPPFGLGPQSFSSTITISGSSQSLTTTLSAAAPALTRLTSVSGNVTAIKTAATYYIAPAGTTTCTYNGDAGTACTPSDSNIGITKALPFATISGGNAKIAGKSLGAGGIFKFNLANGAYRPAVSGVPVVFDNSTSVGKRFFSYFLSGGAITAPDVMPNAYIELAGDDTTFGNVKFCGTATTGSPPSGCTTGATDKEGITFLGTVGYVHGIEFDYFGGRLQGPLGFSNSIGFVANITGTTDDSTSANAPCLIVARDGAQVSLGGSLGLSANKIQNYCTFQSYGSGTYIINHTPNEGFPTLRAAHSQSNVSVFVAQRGGFAEIYGMSGDISGAGSFFINQVGEFGAIYWYNETGVTETWTFNAPNATMNFINSGGIIREQCSTTGAITCTITALSRRNNVSAGGSFIISPPAGPGGGFTNGDIVGKGGQVYPGFSVLPVSAEEVFQPSAGGINPITTRNASAVDQWAVNDVGLLKLYNAGRATADQGEPVIDGAFTSGAGSSSSIGSTALVATSPVTTRAYAVNWAVFQFAGGSGGTCNTNSTLTLTFSWTDASNIVQTKNVVTTLALPPVLAAGAFADGVENIYIKGSSAINYSTTYVASNCTTPQTYILALRAVIQ